MDAERKSINLIKMWETIVAFARLCYKSISAAESLFNRIYAPMYIMYIYKTNADMLDGDYSEFYGVEYLY